MNKPLKIGAMILVLASVIGIGWRLTRPDPRANPIVANGEASITVLPFASFEALGKLPEGWTHRRFWTSAPMELSISEKDSVKAMRCETDNSASILMRSTDIDLGTNPILAWDWLVEVPLISDIDEATKEGDDHPIRLLVQLVDTKGARHVFEIIWSNQKYVSGEYKYIEEFPHYVANGLDENIGQWQHQEVDLMKIYRDISNQEDNPIMRSIGLFCDSDNTGAASVAYITDVVLHRR